MVGPTQPDSVTTVATNVATSGPQRNVVPAPRDQRHFDVTERASSGIQIANAIAFTASPPTSDQGTIRTTTASAIQTAAAQAQLRQRAVALRQQHIGQAEKMVAA